MKSKHWLISLITAIGIVLPVLAVSPAERVRAADSVDLTLGGTGATSWNITNVKPGDSGNKSVTLSNVGTLGGFVTIWASNVTSISGPPLESKTGEPGEFADYLELNVSCPGLQTNLTLPVVIKNFPQSSTGVNYVRIDPLAAGGTVNLTWQWELPIQTGNNIQGDSISFNINYLLENLGVPEPPGGGGGGGGGGLPKPTSPPMVLRVDLGDNQTTMVGISANGTIESAIRQTDYSGNFTLAVDNSTRVTGFDAKALGRIELRIVEAPLVISENMTALSPVYRMVGYTQNREISEINFNPSAIITINYDPGNLPENAFPPFIARYADGSSFERFGLPPGSVFELGKARGVAYHASYFVVLAEMAPPPLLLPPNFRVSNLTISPPSAGMGQPVSVSVSIANEGDTGGSYELYLSIDGIVMDVKEVTVDAKGVVTPEFIVPNLAPGSHQVKVGGLSDELVVVSEPLPEVPMVNWLRIDLMVAVAVVVTLVALYLIIIRRSHQSPLE
ncbi:MAG: hypothetical protein PHU08_02065 [Dehalococcoidales bacterium]|nr:hypothetical protein [Dehalococcoidales bacterium]